MEYNDRFKSNADVVDFSTSNMIHKKQMSSIEDYYSWSQQSFTVCEVEFSIKCFAEKAFGNLKF